MAFDLQKFVDLREYIYHVTDPANLDSLRKDGTIRPATELLSLAACSQLNRQKRAESLPIKIGGQTIILRDQKPLVSANVEYLKCNESDFVVYLNQHVHFWPRDPIGGGSRGGRFRNHYRDDAVLRIPTRELRKAMRDGDWLFCAFNAGATPRKQHGACVSRSLEFFQTAEEFPGKLFEVVQVLFRSAVGLPERTELYTSGGWSKFRIGAHH